MSLHFKFGSSDQPAEAKKMVSFNVEPLMCMEKCAKAIAFALNKINIPAHDLSFDIPNKRVTVTMPESMDNQTVISTLTAHGRKAQEYVPVAQKVNIFGF